MSSSGTHEVERSAGGVLIKYDEETRQTEVCLIQVPTRGGNPSWRLPKGWIEPEETSEQAALRETREETGCHGDVLGELSEIEYWYTRRGERPGERIRVQKIVKFYIMRYTSGSIADHDHEVEEVRWYSFVDALKDISYDAEKRVLQEAIHSWDAHLYRKGLI
jgi:8-oxo-dGTP pyrophosphatase MutT (NUDIX family)